MGDLAQLPISTAMEDLMQVFFLANGKTVILDEKGQEMPEFQRDWLELSLNFLADRGFPVEKAAFNCPNGYKPKPFLDEYGSWKW